MHNQPTLLKDHEGILLIAVPDKLGSLISIHDIRYLTWQSWLEMHDNNTVEAEIALRNQAKKITSIPERDIDSYPAESLAQLLRQIGFKIGRLVQKPSVEID